MSGHNEYHSPPGRVVYPSNSENGMKKTVVAPESAEVEKTEVRCDGGSGGTSRNSSGGSDPLRHPTVIFEHGR